MDQHRNLAYSLVATAPVPALSGTTLVVTGGQGSRFPTVPFNATVWAIGEIPTPANAEIVRVTNITGDTLTITRAQEGTIARAVVLGDQIAATVTVKTFTDIETAFAGTNGAITNGSITVNSSGVSVNLPAYLTTAALSQDSSKYAGTNGAMTGGSITVNTSGVSVNLPAYLTTAGLSQDSSKYAGTVGAITGGSITVNTAGVSVNLPAYLTTAAQSNHSHGNPTLALTNLAGTTASNSAGLTLSLSATAQTTQTQNLHNLTLSGNTSGALAQISSGTWTLAGGNNITLSQAGNAVTISGANVGGAQTGISGVIVSDATYTSGTVSFSNQANITIASSVNGATQYIRLSGNAAQTTQTQNLHNLTLSGNTAGALAAVSSGTLTLAGGNNITLSQAGNAITISGANLGGAQTGISGLVVSDTTYTSGTVSFSNVGNITISSSVNGATQFVRLSVAAQTAQTQNLHNLTISGNTAGALAAVSSGTLTLAGGNNITLSQAGNAITISGANIGGAQTGISGVIVSDATYTLGTVSFSNAGNITISSSVNGATQFIRLSGNAAQTVQTQNLHNLTISGNTSGALAAISSGTLTLAGGNNITLSQAGNAITISGPNVGGAQTGISGIQVSDTTYTSGTVSWRNANGISFGSSGAQGISASYTVPTLPAQFSGGFSTNGNTLGNTGLVTGRLNLAGGNNITLSGSTNGGSITITISAGTGAGQSAIEGLGVSNTGNTAGNTGVSTGIDFVLAGSNGITISQSTAAGTHTLWVSGTTYSTYDTATTGYPVASANSIGTAGRWAAEDHRHAGIGAIGISTGNTSGTSGSVVGTYWVAGGNNITVSQITSNNGSHTLVLSGANVVGAQTGISGIVASNTTYTSGTVSFSNQANITIGSSVDGATQYIRLSGNAAQTVQTQNLHNVTLAGNTAGVMAQISSGTLTLAGGNNITLSQAGNAVTISAGAGGAVQTGISGIVVSDATYTSGTVSFSNAGNITISSSVNGATQFIRLSGHAVQTGVSGLQVSNTTYTSGTVTFQNANGISFGSSGANGISASHNALTSQSTQFLALTLGGNTAGTSTFHATNNVSLFLNGGNNITLSGNGSTVTISAAAQSNQQMTLFATGNTTQSSTGTSNASSLIFAGSGIAFGRDHQRVGPDQRPVGRRRPHEFRSQRRHDVQPAVSDHVYQRQRRQLPTQWQRRCRRRSTRSARRRRSIRWRPRIPSGR